MKEHDSRKDYRVLITGGSGFIGTNMVDFYRVRGAVILNLDPAPPLKSDQRVFWRKHDILDSKGTIQACREFAPTHVVHLAARADLDEKHDVNAYAVNIEGVRNLLEGVQQAGTVKHVVIASTMFVCEPGYKPTADDDYCPHTVYGESKVQSEKITREYGLDCLWTIVRPAMIWGPWHMRLRDEFFTVLQRGLYFHPGNTKARRSYGYVGNTVFQIDAIFNAPSVQVDKKVFYLSDPPASLYDWTDGFSRELINKPVRKMPYFIIKALALCGDMFVSLGWKDFPMTSFRLDNMTSDNIVDTEGINQVAWPLPYSTTEGIRETVRWLKSV